MVSPAVDVARMAVDKVARRYVMATAGVVVVGTGWCVAYLTIGAGTEAFAYIFVPIGGLLTTASVYHMLRGSNDLDRVARRFWRAALISIAVITIGYGWLGVDMLTHASQAH